MIQSSAKSKTFVDPQELLHAVPIEPGMIVADFGCGNGYYAIAAGKLTGKKGQVHALDLLEDCLSQTATLAKLNGLHNVSTQKCDLEKLGSCPLADISCDLVVISSILHQVANQDNVIREAYRVLKTGGYLVVVEWDSHATFGPHLASRVSREELGKLLEKFGMRPVKELSAGAFHYALLYQK